MANFDQKMPGSPPRGCYVGTHTVRHRLFLTVSQADSYSLWESVCKNKLLSNATLCLFLNKTDLLMSKLNSGMPPDDLYRPCIVDSM